MALRRKKNGGSIYFQTCADDQLFVFVMMLVVDFIDTASQRRMSDLIKGGRWRQYMLASFLWLSKAHVDRPGAHLGRGNRQEIQAC